METASPDESVPAHVLDAYGAAGASTELLTGGRTNRTLRVRAGQELVLQQLRAFDGVDLLGIMENLVRVTSHLDWKTRVAALEAGISPSEPVSWWPELVPTTANKPYLVDEERSVWRAFRYRPGRIARAHLPSESMASVARLFGRFSHATFDLDGPELLVTTPHFHDLGYIWTSFETQLSGESSDAATEVREQLEIVNAVRQRLMQRIGDDGLDELPARVVHNDTKISNVLLHETSSDAIAVLDLDLAMMGPIWHDVGDLMRSIAWHADDEAPAMTPALFDAVSAAFVRGAGETLSDAELATFAVAGPRLAFELGVRYLQGHLDPENALRVEGDRGRLLRGLANVKLAEEMLNAYDALRSVVDDLIARR